MGGFTEHWQSLSADLRRSISERTEHQTATPSGGTTKLNQVRHVLFFEIMLRFLADSAIML
jgi:hypothetical protein